ARPGRPTPDPLQDGTAGQADTRPAPGRHGWAHRHPSRTEEPQPAGRRAAHRGDSTSTCTGVTSPTVRDPSRRPSVT
ncbi:hypothetical protein, partial [Dactylosporangium siamense]|uniref:hypothetical protein n=1 Tax=Dactylosporangium siamense TaxID=685454 RepID=UPI0019434139